MIGESEKTDLVVVVKRLSDRRWSARHDGVRALSLAYQEHIDLLQEISSSEETRGEVKSEAIGLSKRLKELESSILLQLWNIILERMN